MYCIRDLGDCCDCSQFVRDLAEQLVEYRVKKEVAHAGKFFNKIQSMS